MGPFRHLRAAVTMVARNGKAYRKLSITVVLTFTILLGYMASIDADLFNRYAFLSSLPREVVVAYTYDATAHHAFLSQLHSTVSDANEYSYYRLPVQLDDYCIDGAEAAFIAEGVFLPDGGVTAPYFQEGLIGTTAFVQPLQMLSGKPVFQIAPDEVIINESFYKALTKGGGEPPTTISAHFNVGDGRVLFWLLKIVGVCEDQQQNRFFVENGSQIGCVSLFLNQSLLDEVSLDEMDGVCYATFTSSDTPQEVISCARSLDMPAQGVALAQDEANRVLFTESRAKGVTAAVMLILLAINLYSSFSNVLETRCFEIGVKRALGASRFDIMRQFLYEGALVLGADTILSVVTVLDCILVYKAWNLWNAGRVWTIYIAPSSWQIFFSCSLLLTAAFSLLFAYRATQVEIIANLKGE